MCEIDPALSYDNWFSAYDAVPGDAPEEQFAKLPPPPQNLTLQQCFRIFDRADYSEGFLERPTSIPREVRIFEP